MGTVRFFSGQHNTGLVTQDGGSCGSIKAWRLLVALATIGTLIAQTIPALGSGHSMATGENGWQVEPKAHGIEDQDDFNADS